MKQSVTDGFAPVRFGIVGTGLIAGTHARAMAAAAQTCSLKAVCDSAADRATAFAAEHGVDAVADLPALLARDDIDAITIATPSGTHGSIAMAAAEAGKHVLCEKPLEITPERIDRMSAVCRAKGVLLGGILPARTSKGVAAMRRALTTGRFGHLVFANVQLKWWRSQQYYEASDWRGTWALDGGGALMNQGIHQIDLMLYLAGEVASVFAYTDTRHAGVEVEDTAVVAVRFANGAMGSIVASTCCESALPRRLELTGERGHAALVDDELAAWMFNDEGPDDAGILAAIEQGHQGAAGAGDPAAIGFLGHQLQIEDFAAAIREGREPMVPSGEARRAVELICAAYESVRRQAPVSFD